MKTVLMLKKTDGSDEANKKTYVRLENFFAKELSQIENQNKAEKTMFIVAEIVDNIFKNEIDVFTYIKIEVTKEDDGSVEVSLEHNGNEFNPFTSPKTIKIQAAIEFLEVKEGPSCETFPKNSAGEYVLLKFNFALKVLTISKPYSYSIISGKDMVTVQFQGKIIRGWGIETDEELIRALEGLKRESSSKVIYFDLNQVALWDTKGSYIVLQAVMDINSKNSRRARVLGSARLKDYIPQFKQELESKLIDWE